MPSSIGSGGHHKSINCEGAIGGVQASGHAVGINVNVTQSDVDCLRGLARISVYTQNAH